MKSFKVSVFFISIIFSLLGIIAMVRIASLVFGKGKYYRGEIEDNKEIVIDGRTFKVETNTISGNRGSISSDDGTVLLSNVFIYDLYWCPSYVGRNDTLFLSKVDSLIKIFHRINPKISIETYNKIVKQEYLNYKQEYEKAIEKTKSKDNKTKKEGHQTLNHLQKKQVRIKVSNLSRTNEWVRQKDIDEIDSLFVNWKGSSRFRGGCQKDRRNVRRQLASGCPKSILGLFDTKPTYNKTDSIIFKQGIEGYFDSLLSGEAITYRILKVNNEIVRLEENKYLSPGNGCNLETTINTDMQRVAKNALEKQLMKYDAAWGCAIVMEVETGEIKAISNLDKVGYHYEERIDHATAERHEPGSTFKLMTLLAALKSEKVDTSTIVACDKGEFSIKKAFIISDNKGIYNAAQKSYPDISSFLLALTKMSFGKNLKIETAQAQTPLLNPITKRKTDFMNITHGYSIKIPPIYMLAYYNAVANNGKYVKPTLVKTIVCPDKEKFFTAQQEIINKAICSPKVIAKAKGCLEAVVTDPRGTAKRALDDQYLACMKNKDENAPDCYPLIAGKTGTAFIYIGKEKKYSNNLDKSHPSFNIKNSSFIGYFPSHKPKYTCLILISGTTADGGEIAVPVCKEIAEKIYIHDSEWELSELKSNTKKNVPSCKIAFAKDVNAIYGGLHLAVKHSEESQYVSVSKTDNDDINISTKIEKQIVSQLRHATAKDVAYLLEKWGYAVILRGKGKVDNIDIVEGKGYKKAIVTFKN